MTLKIFICSIQLSINLAPFISGIEVGELKENEVKIYDLKNISFQYTTEY